MDETTNKHAEQVEDLPDHPDRSEAASPDDPFGFRRGVEFLMTQGAMLAMLPMEKWLEELNHSETIAPFLDPTLYRDYIYSGRDNLIKGVLEAGIGFKRAIKKAQEDVKQGRVR
jgi:hypothetical protein